MIYGARYTIILEKELLMCKTYGRRYICSNRSQAMFERLRQTILPVVEGNTQRKETLLCYKAITQWLSNSAIYEPSFHSFNDLLFDHLLQLTFAADLHPWTQFVDMKQLCEKTNDTQKLYSLACHLRLAVANLSKHQSAPTTNLMDLVARLNAPNGPALPFPSLQAARTFITGKDSIELLDEAYLQKYPQLYKNTTKQLQIVLRCGNDVFAIGKCAHPVTVTAAVTVSQYQASVEARMNDSRQKRSNGVASLFAELLNSSVNGVRLMSMNEGRQTLLVCSRIRLT